MTDAKKPGGYFDKSGEAQKPTKDDYRKGYDNIDWKKKPKSSVNVTGETDAS